MVALALPASALAVDQISYTNGGATISVQAGAGEVNDLYEQSESNGATYFFQENTPGVNISVPGSCFQPGSYAAECPGAGVSSIETQLGDENDNLSVSDVQWPFGLFVRAFGGAGADTVGGSPGADFLNGGGGKDALSGANSDDTLTGGGGGDHLEGGAGPDKLVGDAGHDTLLGGGGSDLLNARDGTADREINCGHGSDQPARFDHGLDPQPKSC